MAAQVDMSYYFGSRYLKPQRFAAYAYQVSEIMRCGPQSVLEIGIGNGVVCHLLRRSGIEVTTLDVDESLGPEVIASVTDIPLADRSFDVVGCFEVLEHLPYESVPGALSEIHRVSRGHALVSLPDAKPRYRVEFTLPGIGHHRFCFGLPYRRPRAHVFTGQHHWEVNARGYALGRVLETMRDAGFDVEHTYRPFEHPTHRFFQLRKRVGERKG
jgi:2-polyprenyl-3-methyl-5-hydroxy-6-metoxy-1,4-benzoquinol methylase